jgi:hypothetical protein
MPETLLDSIHQQLRYTVSTVTNETTIFFSNHCHYRWPGSHRTNYFENGEVYLRR